MHKLLSEKINEDLLMLGNEAIARGAVEAGVGFATTYPGTPSSELSLNLFQISRETDLYFEYSTNEKVALEVAAAAANSGVRTMCMMKHVGLNVAADPLVTLAYIGVTAGLVILTADDPAMFSSQNEQDNRYYGKLAGLPVLEPSSVEEAKEMTRAAFELSEALGEPVLLRTTTRINHSSAFVTLKEITPPVPKGNFVPAPMSYVTVPAVSRKLHVKLLDNLAKASALSDASDLNFITGQGPLGVICNGVSYLYAKDAVKDLGLEEQVKILRIGFSNPMPEWMIKDFIKGCKKVLVVEEGEPFMEEAVKAFAQEACETLPIQGKADDLFSRLSEFDPAMVRENMARFFDVPYTPAASVNTADLPEIPQRPPNLCSGCSHRATFYEVKKAAKAMDVMCPSDIGCYTLGFLPPLSMGDFVLCMGASVSSACGFSRATDKKVVAFIGDSTFFHSGITGLVNAVFNNHNFTLVILDNGITAMTGHQPNPGVDMDQMNLPGYNAISIEKLVRSLGVGHVTLIKPFKVKKSIAAIEEALAFKGVSVIISQEPCALHAKGLKLLKPRAFTVTDKCLDHRDCINEIACPSFYLDKGRVHIDADTCVGCAVCAQICPENAIMPLKKK
ncbi:indolepyruvate ferredoxin oxidoreductase alpha subunit [Desulfocicer vacuolatum DSM 3385]|uniref:Indolepyruvate oxidoreductase subunit IorA n=1 Tax=Desulfocicer vacuolatum DSM 3385 TaxID=1121400 RepID=A0A1W1ZTV3_9BACT|nr:indolepyruvate ferredoxin oxidoreductase subunit alpha [Desulfocicer vacuolatum]SMC51672.1 indolepyruvate ferredoxin oxidoreductase alpha subunit [Desulfocicer vacuolatum DSM 3385]